MYLERIILLVFLSGLAMNAYSIHRHGSFIGRTAMTAVSSDTCSLKAKYFPDSDTVVVNGNPILFRNESVNSNSFAWFINGSFTSSQADLIFYPTLGVSEIKLVASNGICTDTTLSFVIWDENSTVQYRNFQKKYNPEGMAMEPFCMSGDHSKGYLLAGDYYLPSENNFVSKTTALMHIDEKGCVNWAKAMISGQAEVIQSIISTSDSGYLISAFPYQSQQSNYPNDLIVFKIDKSGNREWAHSFSNGTTVNNYYSAICETTDKGFALEIGSFPIAGNPSFISVIKIDRLGRFIWGRKLAMETNSFYNVGGIMEKNKFLYVTGSIYDGAPPYDIIRSFLMQIDELTGQTVWTKQNDPGMPPLSFTDIHNYKSGLFINSYSGNLLNNLYFPIMMEMYRVARL